MDINGESVIIPHATRHKILDCLDDYLESSTFYPFSNSKVVSCIKDHLLRRSVFNLLFKNEDFNKYLADNKLGVVNLSFENITLRAPASILIVDPKEDETEPKNMAGVMSILLSKTHGIQYICETEKKIYSPVKMNFLWERGSVIFGNSISRRDIYTGSGNVYILKLYLKEKRIADKQRCKLINTVYNFSMLLILFVFLFYSLFFRSDNVIQLESNRTSY